MSKYKEFEHVRDIPENYIGWYYNDEFETKGYCFGHGLQVDISANSKNFYYYDVKGSVDTSITREEFEYRLEVTKSKVWRALYGK